MRNLPVVGGYPFAEPGMAPDGPLLWQPDRIPVAVLLDAAPSSFTHAQQIDPARIGGTAEDYLSFNGRHLVVTDSSGDHRLWVYDAAGNRPVAAIIPLDTDFETRITTLLRFHRRLLGRPSGPSPRGWELTPFRRNRLLRMIRAFDLKQAGASYRAIAVALGSDEAAALSATEWKISASRSWTIRLVHAAHDMVNGGYRRLLSLR